MAFTIQQLQNFSNTKPELRYLTEEIIDYLQANQGGGSLGSSYLVWDAAYQNSAMSSPVGVYLYKDAIDNIWKVYEPSRNNLVSRSQYAYADSIDKFPFDSADCYNNNLSDVKLVGVPSNVKITKCTLQYMVIDGGSFSGLQINNTIFHGTSGIGCPNNVEILVVGVNVLIEGCSFLNGSLFYSSFIDSIGANSQIIAISSPNSGTGLYIQGHANVYLGDGTFYEDFSSIYVYDDFLSFFDFLIGGTVVVHCPSDFASCSRFVIGDNTTIGTATERFKKIKSLNVGSDCVLKPTTNNTDILDKVTLGVGCTVTTSGNKTNAEYKNLGGTTYLLGEAAGAMTLTAV